MTGMLKCGYKYQCFKNKNVKRAKGHLKNKNYLKGEINE